MHRRDTTRAFRLALEKGAADSTFQAVAEGGVPSRAIAEVIGRGLNLKRWLAHFLAMDVVAASIKTRKQLGRQPQQPGLISDLGQGRYFQIRIKLRP